MKHISQYVSAFLKKSGLNQRHELGTLVEKWPEIAGDYAKGAVPFKLDKKKLFIEADNSAVLNELSYRKKQIKISVNRMLGREAVGDVVLRLKQ
ncbi:MAG TPA: DUF721 domain-containing protein [Candidatus Goldiibacteriota bacterium]|nr:DUF721 domain-containing protein [Candidatus Goldiibacteriota bacterium]